MKNANCKVQSAKGKSGDGKAYVDAVLARAKRDNGQPAIDGDAAAWRDLVPSPQPLAPGPSSNLVDHYTLDLDPALIDPSPFQPRRAESFEPNEIADLAATIRDHGLLVPILVRPSGKKAGRYELVDGERRLRACKMPVSGQKTIRAEVRTLGDAEARRIVLVTSLQRKDLDAIEEARAYQQLIDAGDAAGPTEVARLVGVSQGQVSSRLHLLELPERWQAKIISREMPATHARAVLPYRACPGILAAIEKEVKLCRDCHEDVSIGDFEELIDTAIRRATRRLDQEGRHCWQVHKRLPPFVPNAQQRAKLGIITIQDEAGKPRELATKCKLFDQLRQTHDNAAEKAALAKGESGKSANCKVQSAKGKSPEKAKPLTEAETKAAADRERRRIAEQGRLTAGKVWRWKIRRLRAAVADALTRDEIPDRSDDADFLVLFFLVSSRTWSASLNSREEILASVLGKPGHWRPEQVWPAIAAVKPAEIGKRLVETVRRFLWDDDAEVRVPMSDSDVLAIASFPSIDSIDLAALWKEDQRGPWGTEFYELHTNEQLDELCKELKGPYFPLGADKATKIRLLQQAGKPLPLPRELAGKKKG